MSAYLDALDGELFFGRGREMKRFAHAARDLGRGWGRSVFLAGRPGSGRTELLTQFHRRLFDEAGVCVPVYYRPDPSLGTSSEAAASLAGALAGQFIAFRRHNLSAGSEGMDGGTVVRELGGEEGAAGDILREALSRFTASGPPFREALALLAHFARETGWRICLFLDDAHRLPAGAVDEMPGHDIFRGRSTAVFMAGETRLLAALECRGEGSMVESWHVGPLLPDGALQLARSLLRAAGIELSPQATEEAARLSGGYPGPLEIIIRGLERKPGNDVAAVCRAYASSVSRGGLYRYWNGIITDSFPDPAGRRTALEILAYCIREDHPPEAGRLAAGMIKEGGEVAAALRGLTHAGLISPGSSRVIVSGESTLRDFVRASYEREAGGRGEAFIEAELAARKAAEAASYGAMNTRRQNRDILGDFLLGWKLRQVPAVLFRFAEFERLFAAAADDEVLRSLDKGPFLTLPEVVSVASGKTGPESGGIDIDALAWAFSGPAADSTGGMCWVVGVHDGVEAGDEEVERFETAADAVEHGSGMEKVRVVRWFVASRFTADALRKGGRQTLFSSFRQARLLGKILGRPLELAAAGVERRGAPGERLDFEMTIPMVSETELVAARAVEQLAEIMNFDADEVGRIRMAIVEACINAFEHSGREGGKVRLRFSSDPDSLRIRVENRGRKFSPGKIAPVSARKAMTKRGWGLSLIRELMDEVDFEPKEDGATIIMVKHIRGKEGPGEQVRDNDKDRP